MLMHVPHGLVRLCAPLTLVAALATSLPDAIQAQEPPRPSAHRAVFDPVDYGADPSGKTDSSPAFQRLVADMGKLRRAKIVIPPGVYLLSAPIEISASGNLETYGLAIKGAGQDVTELLVDNPQGGILWQGEQMNMLSVSVSDLSIVAARDHAGVGLQFSKRLLGVKHRTQFLAENVLIRGARFDVGSFDTGLVVRGAWYPRLRNVQVAGPYGVDEERTLNTMSEGILLEDSYNPMISHCRVWSAGDGLIHRSGEVPVEDGSIINSYFVGVKRGIVVQLREAGQWEEPGLRISQCHIAYRDYGVTIRGNRQATIDHCLFYCMDRAGAAFPMYQDSEPRDFIPVDIDLEAAGDVIIDGNLFTEPANPARVAVRIGKQSGYVLIRGNQFNLEGLAVRNLSPQPSWSQGNFFGGRRNFTRSGPRHDDQTGTLVIDELN